MTVRYNGREINLRVPKLEAVEVAEPLAPMHITHLLSDAVVPNDFDPSWVADMARPQADVVLHDQMWAEADMPMLNRVAQNGLRGSSRLTQLRTRNSYNGRVLEAIAHTQTPQAFSGMWREEVQERSSPLGSYQEKIREVNVGAHSATYWLQNNRLPSALHYINRSEGWLGRARLQHDGSSIKKIVDIGNHYIRRDGNESLRITLLGITEDALQSIALANKFETIDVSIRSPASEVLDYSLVPYYNFLNNRPTMSRDLLKQWGQAALYQEERKKHPHASTGHIVVGVNEWLRSANNDEIVDCLRDIYSQPKIPYDLRTTPKVQINRAFFSKFLSLPAAREATGKHESDASKTVYGFGRGITDIFSVTTTGKGKSYERKGGKVVNAMIAAARLGLAAGIVGPIGGQDTREILQKEGVDTTWPDKQVTNEIAEIYTFKYDDKSTELPHFGDSQYRWSDAQRKRLVRKFYKQKPAQLDAIDAIYLTLEGGTELTREIILGAQALKNASIYINASPEYELRRADKRLLQEARFVIANQPETKILSKEIDITDKPSAIVAARRACTLHDIPGLITTLGPDGLVYVSQRDDKELYVPGFPIIEADAMAAGDSTAAAIMACDLRDGEVTKRGLAMGCLVGAIVAARGQGYEGIPTLEELKGDVIINDNYSIPQTVIAKYLAENSD
jgi:sugar/nucleoside kinase (ribokinase family)